MSTRFRMALGMALLVVLGESAETRALLQTPAGQAPPSGVPLERDARLDRVLSLDETGMPLDKLLAEVSGEGVTLLPFGGWYTRSYAWGRRPLREAGLT